MYLIELTRPGTAESGELDTKLQDEFEQLSAANASAKRVRLLERWRSTEKITEIEKRALKLYVPEVVLQGTTAGVAGQLHEIRKLTCVFIDIELDLIRRDALEALQKCFETILTHGVID